LIRNNRGSFRGSVCLDIRDIPGNGLAVFTATRFLQVPVQNQENSCLVIGRVLEGMNVVDKLQPTHEFDDALETVPVESAIPDRVIRVSVLRKPEGKEYKPIGAN